jgi:HK97 gp10 family phage protein
VIVIVRLLGSGGRLIGRAAAGLGRAGLRDVQAVGRQVGRFALRQIGKRAQGDAGGLDFGGQGFGLGGGGNPAREAGAATVAKAAKMMVAEAQRRAPVDTGRLRDSIQARQLGPLAWEVSAEAPYAEFVEYGTSTNPAQPYFRPAFEVVKAQFGDMAVAELNAAIDRAAR